MASADKLACSFCGKRQDEVWKLIAGPSVYICDECVALCVDILADQGDSTRWLFSRAWRAWWRRLNHWMVPPATPSKPEAGR